jgi:hypothetical protein
MYSNAKFIRAIPPARTPTTFDVFQGTKLVRELPIYDFINFN